MASLREQVQAPEWQQNKNYNARERKQLIVLDLHVW